MALEDRDGARLVRILLATDYYPPYIGGAQIQSRLLGHELRARGHEVVVATVWQNDLPKNEDDNGVPVHRLRQMRTLPFIARRRRQHHQPPFADPVTAFALRRLIRRFKPDVVHSYGWLSFSCAVALLGDKTPLVITARDYGYTCANRTLMRDGVECTGPAIAKCVGCAGRHYGAPKGWIAALGVRWNAPLLRRKVAAVHSISTYVRAIMRRDFLDERGEDKGHVIHDVIGSVRHEPDARPRSLPWLDQLPNEPFILFVGAFRRIKGIEELLRAYETLDDPPRLVLIGTREPDSPDRFPDGVSVLTDFPHEAVLASAGSERCLFGVMPSLFPEPFGTVVCEVMSCGKPVIGTEPGGHSDMIVNEESGLLVPRGDVEALAAAMRSLIVDPVKRERLGRAAQQRASQFGAEVTIPRLERLYARLAHGDGAR